MIQKSAANGSQRGFGVSVIVGVMDRTRVGGEDEEVIVGTIWVFTITTGVTVTPVVAQDTKIINKKRFKICFITSTLESARCHLLRRSKILYSILNPSTLADCLADFLLQLIGFCFDFFQLS